MTQRATIASLAAEFDATPSLIRLLLDLREDMPESVIPATLTGWDSDAQVRAAVSAGLDDIRPAPAPKRTTTTCECDHHGRAEEAMVDAIELEGHYQGHELLRANVEATLALVDEQRTANLIAVVNMRWPDGSGLLGAPAIEQAAQQVRERLGLNA